MSKRANQEIRDQIKALGLFHWQIADEIGISEHCFCQWLRHELEGERLERVQTAIKQLSGGNTDE